MCVCACARICVCVCVCVCGILFGLISSSSKFFLKKIPYVILSIRSHSSRVRLFSSNWTRTGQIKMQGNKTNRDNREINLVAHGFRSTKDKSFADPWRDRDAENVFFLSSHGEGVVLVSQEHILSGPEISLSISFM